MAKPYSKDLRRRVVGTIEGGATIPEAADQCGVSISSVVRFLRLHRETGSVRSQLDKAFEKSTEITFGAGIQDMKVQPEGMRYRLRGACNGLGKSDIGRVD